MPKKKPRSLNDIRISLVNASSACVSRPPEIDESSTILPPLGLGYIAAFLEKNGVRNIDLFDINLDFNYSLFLLRYRPHIIGFYVTTPSIPILIKLVKQTRTLLPDSVIVLGGPHIAAVGSSLLYSIPEIDLCVVGNGEVPLLSFVKYFLGENNLEDIPNIIFRREGEVIISESSMMLKSLDQLPFPKHDLFQFNRYRLSGGWGFFEKPIASMITSRGCPYSCSYCTQYHSKTPNILYRSVDNIVEEVEYLVKKFRIKTIAFWDDTFTFNKARIFELCSKLENLSINWYCNTRADCVDRCLLQAMRNAGCNAILYGVESLDDRILKTLNRQMTTDHIIQAIEDTASIGIRPIASLMIGTPDDDETSIMGSVNKAIRLPAQFIRVSLFNILPGTPEFYNAVREGYLDEKIEWGCRNTFPGPPVGLPTFNKTLNREELQKIFKKVIRIVNEPESLRFRFEGGCHNEHREANTRYNLGKLALQS